MLPVTKEELKSPHDRILRILKKNLKKALIGKSEIIATIQVNMEAPHIVFVI